MRLLDVCGLRNNHILYFTSPFINNEIDLNSLTRAYNQRGKRMSE